MRILHKWIQVNDRNLATLIVTEKFFSEQHAIMIFPGYSLAKTDTLYFMSALAYELSNAKYFVIMVDPVGHGESDGDLSDFTLTELNMTISATIDYLRRFIKGKIYGIGRGIGATTLVQHCDNTELDGVIAINPFTFSPKTILSILPNEVNDHMNFTQILHSHPLPSKLKSFFHALGAEISNLNGQIISKDFLKELVAYDFSNLDAYRNENVKIVFTNGVNVESNDNQLLDYFANETLPHSIKVTQMIIDECLDWLKLSSEKKYDCTYTN